MKGWPSYALGLSRAVATISGSITFLIPRFKLYSPRGDRHDPSGGLKSSTLRKSWTRRVICFPFNFEGSIDSLYPFPNSLITRFAMDGVTPLRSSQKNLRRVLDVDLSSNCWISRLFTFWIKIILRKNIERPVLVCCDSSGTLVPRPYLILYLHC